LVVQLVRVDARELLDEPLSLDGVADLAHLVEDVVDLELDAEQIVREPDAVRARERVLPIPARDREVVALVRSRVERLVRDDARPETILRAGPRRETPRLADEDLVGRGVVAVFGLVLLGAL